MANLKEIRTRINSVKSTQQITSAMKMVSAAKLRKSQTAITLLRPYAAKMNEILSELGSQIPDDSPYVRKPLNKRQNVLLIVLTSNKGLCSVFNTSIVKLAVQKILQYQALNYNVWVMSYGKKGDAALKKMSNVNYLGTNNDIWDALSFDEVNNQADRFIDDFLQKKYDRIEILYNQFKNAATQIPTTETFLPLFNDESLKSETESQRKHDYIFAPDKNEILTFAIPQKLKTQFYKCFLESFTSEHGARMSSMNKATDNADSLLKELTLTYNKQRQSAITNQIIEVSNGANAV